MLTHPQKSEQETEVGNHFYPGNTITTVPRSVNAPGTVQEENGNMTESNTFKISVAKTTIRYSFTRRKAKKWIFNGTVLRKPFSNFRVVPSKRVSNSSFCYIVLCIVKTTIQKYSLVKVIIL